MTSQCMKLVLGYCWAGRKAGSFLEVASNVCIWTWEGGLTGSALCLSGPLKRLAYSFSGSLLQRQSTSQGNMGDSEPPEILYETCACIIHY